MGEACDRMCNAKSQGINEHPNSRDPHKAFSEGADNADERRSEHCSYANNIIIRRVDRWQ
jgi:hypothetical protein